MKFIAITALAVCLAVPASAQSNCGPTAILTAKLADKFGETPIFNGLTNKGLVSVWINPETGSWSALFTNPNGSSCLVSSGKNGEFIPPLIGDPT
ncbi:MAG: hypothetical protein JKY94_09055 [Rhodobacteraceae bacterium]|nr:hypothetical protein [Paracoccaceae bacterium]